MRVVTGSQMREIDKAAIENMGIDGLELMENAGSAIFSEIMSGILGSMDPMVLVVCGGGNNGGDGYVAARYLSRAKVKVAIFSTVDPKKLIGDARINYQECCKLPITITSLHEGIESEEGLAAFMALSDELGRSTIVVDGIFGTGISRAVTGVPKLTIEMINKCGKPVIAIDIPSGVSADDGLVRGTAVRANTTVALQAPKLGCLIYPGTDYTGNLVIKDIGIPKMLIQEITKTITLMDQDYILEYIKKRPKNLHKGDFGKVLIIAGSKGMAGAAALCARAALRTGAGLVRVAVNDDILDVVQMLIPEATCLPRDEIVKKTSDYDAIVIGPGLGTEAGTKELIIEIMGVFTGTLIVDADGLNAIDDLTLLLKSKSRLILTPHPGEAGRLLNCITEQINSQRLDSVRQLSSKTGAVAVLKGAASLIAMPDGRVTINNTGNPGMATAGSGDVLSGIIAALAAQGIDWEQAAQVGVYLHGQAGDIMAGQIGEYGLIASDLCVGVALAINSIVHEAK